ncbi:uncharacterized protein K489DRAFT_61548 [Dissoconium aciculare CBS 342.82]|uniref:Uncharacterized protein n=1 Tax=Dissoconium aciculare CBS 342.82 TaxID=1314786 RepID=A0A6J3LX75_9PEZI|nr:uncharacterized protein K489DRAFT_61548 [Dissoconium aciculare CBS 342.82]KAF1819904.1 hypothetical protein K489DRAFT_61548 [Dissoconium aciculare CBS 342.82]
MRTHTGSYRIATTGIDFGPLHVTLSPICILLVVGLDHQSLALAMKPGIARRSSCSSVGACGQAHLQTKHVRSEHVAAFRRFIAHRETWTPA